MSEPDVVAELDAWITAGAIDGRMPDNPVVTAMRQARDEIVALRDEMKRKIVAFDRAACENARSGALEEAASICENLRPYAGANGSHHYLACAAAIRALKDKP